MIDKILKQAKSYPEKIAYKYNESSLTYGELIFEAKKLADKLGKVKTTNVVLYGHKEIFMPIGIVACLIAKKTYIPIDYYWPENRIVTVLKDLSNYIIISEKRISGYKTYKIHDPLQENDNCLTTDISYVIFTSGSTGKPKGVPISANNLSCFTNWISDSYPFFEYRDLNIFDQASFSFDLSVADFYYGLCNGHTLITNDEKVVSIDFLKNNKINLLFITPSYLQLLLFDPLFNADYLDSIKCIYLCGEQLSKKLVIKLNKRFKNTKVINAYGPTEATSAISMHLINNDDMLNYDYLPVGDMNNLTCKVTIQDSEIILEGESVFKGYMSSNKRIVYYHTGDIGEIKNGLLFCKGRLDKQIKYCGYRIELGEIENTLNLIPDVDSSIVKASKNESGAVVSIDAIVYSKSIKDETLIKDFLRRYLPNYMIPKNIEFVEKITLNDNDKMISR